MDISIMLRIISSRIIKRGFDYKDQLKNKRVLITGASQGIGEQLAYHFASHGAKLALTARSGDALHKVAKRCTERSGSNLTHDVIVADMSDMNSTKFVIQETISKLGGLDILVLNHITTDDFQPYRGTEANLAHLDRNMDINFRSYAYMASHALQELVSNEGRIVVVNSLVGKVGHPYVGSYAASKFAVDGFFTSLRSQFVAENTQVSVTMCYLGFIGTDNAVRQLQQSGQNRLLKTMTPESPSQTADVIVRAAAHRKYEIYFPYLGVKPMVVLHSLAPGLVDFVMRFWSAKS